MIFQGVGSVLLRKQHYDFFQRDGGPKGVGSGPKPFYPSGSAHVHAVELHSKNGHSQNYRKLVFKTNYRFFRSNFAECSKVSMLQYF